MKTFTIFIYTIFYKLDSKSEVVFLKENKIPKISSNILDSSKNPLGRIYYVENLPLIAATSGF